MNNELKNYLVKVTVTTTENDKTVSEYVISTIEEAPTPGVAIQNAISFVDAHEKTWKTNRIATADFEFISYNAKFCKQVSSEFALVFNDYNA